MGPVLYLGIYVMIPMVWVISLDIESLLNDVDPMNPDLSTPILDFQAG